MALRGTYRSLLAALAVASSFASTACSGRAQTPPPADTTASKKATPSGPVQTRVTALDVSNENLNVDKISMRDGAITPDGTRDLVFTATVEGPADALYLVTVTPKGEPLHGFRADTIVGHEQLPDELGSVVDVGRLTVWIAVVENGKFINDEGGTLGRLLPGAHSLKLYVPNTGNLHPGTHLRLYARIPGGGLVAGPIVKY